MSNVFTMTLHRDGDLPTVVTATGTKMWYMHGVLHRDSDLPAVEEANGTKAWYKNGKKHRDNDLPAIEHKNGDKEWYKEWYKDGVLHRDGDLPAYMGADGIYMWYKDGKLHRDGDLPAVENAVFGTKAWYKNGKRHRDRGPAVTFPEPKITATGEKKGKVRRENEWWYEGQYMPPNYMTKSARLSNATAV